MAHSLPVSRETLSSALHRESAYAIVLKYNTSYSTVHMQHYSACRTVLHVSTLHNNDTKRITLIQNESGTFEYG